MRIAVIGLVELAEATTWTGDPTVELFAGEVTVTPALEIAVNAKVISSSRTAFFTAPLLRGLRSLVRRGRRLEMHLLWMYQEST